jgi:haloalkane dehalogenase
MQESDWLNRSEYPFQHRYIDLEPGRLHYIDEGSGAPILMVHGNPTWSFLYRNMIKALTPEHRCIAPDHLGFGLSDKPLDWTYLPQEHAENLSMLINSLQLENITLMVQDWGGPIGLSLAVNNPQIFNCILIMNTWMWPVNRDLYYMAFSSFTGGVLGRWLIRKFNFFVNTIMPQAYADRLRFTPEIRQHYQKPLQNPQERIGCWTLPGEILKSSDWLESLWARRSALEEIPILFVWGMKDIAFREKELNTWSEAFPDAKVVRLENVGHYVQEEGHSELEANFRKFLETP